MDNPNPQSPRMTFQWKYFNSVIQLRPSDPQEYEQLMGHPYHPPVLNIGCSDDPMGFGSQAVHFDMDDWSKHYEFFVRGDAHDLSVFRDREFDLVIMGDIVEHLVDPMKAVLEAARVCNGQLVMTIFEEWRLPAHGQFISVGQQLCDEDSVKLGYANREAYQVALFPDRVGEDDDLHPHLSHINQLTDADVELLVMGVIEKGFRPLELLKMFEVQHEGHDIYNWLVAMERIS